MHRLRLFEILAFKLYCDLETGVNMPLSIPFPRYSSILVVNRRPSAPPLEAKQQLLVTKNGVMGPSDVERISMIRSAVLIQITRVTDGQTELPWHTRYSIYAVERKNHCSRVERGRESESRRVLV